MSILVGLHHATRYDYDRPISLGPQVVRLRPGPHCRTRIPSYSLTVQPAHHFVNWLQDPHGNWLARFVFPEKTKEFSVTVDLLADMEVINPFDFFVEPYAETWPFEFPPELHEDLAAFVEPEPAGPLLKELVRSISREPRNTVNFLVDLNQRLQRMIRYLIRMEPGVQTPEETLASAAGSCRDTAWLLVQLLRHIGLPARFVSGYLIQLRPDIKPLEGAAGTDHDFTDLHAWTEVYVPGAGWVGLDPTSGLLCGEGHLPVAATPHFRSAAAISGLVEPSGVCFSFEMNVKRIAEQPRVTAPFSDAAWTALNALGEKVDADLVAHDARLTMGGEPTFVSVDDYQSAEWNTAALGPMKRLRADDLIRRLRDRFAAGGLMHYGQGKWYPGEPLPRWAFSLYWRRDGVPIWRDDSLIAREAAAQKPSPDAARRLAEGIAARLGIMADYVQPAYEDPTDRMLKQGLIPENVDPSDPKIDDPHERARPTGRVRAAAATLDGAGETVAERAVANHCRLALSDAGRFGAWLPAAAAVVAQGRSCRLSASCAGRSVRRTPAVAGSPRQRSDPSQGGFHKRGDGSATRARDVGHAASQRRRRTRWLRCAGTHGSDSRSAGRTLVHLHAADRSACRLSRFACRGRDHRSRDRPAGAHRRL
jgi:transglutaminase-like putative cysteine protease